MEIKFRRITAYLAAVTACAGLAVLSTPATVYASKGIQCQIANMSDWVGYYEAKDGSCLIIESVSETSVYLGYIDSAEAGGEEGQDVLTFNEQARTQAESTQFGESARYTLNRESVTVERPDQNGVHSITRYARKNGKYTWLKLQDDVYYWMQDDGAVLKDGVTPDGWYVGSDGCWDPYMGMGPFQSGTYTSHDGTKVYGFHLKEDMSMEEWRLKDASDKRMVGTVEYSHISPSGEEDESRSDMRLINMMEGYVVVDTAGRIVADLYPVGDTGQIMLRRSGEQGYESLTLR